MLESIVQKLSSLAESKIAEINFDPSRFNDELALKTEWTPCKWHGTNFKTHSFKQKSADLAEFSASMQVMLFAAIFFIAGVAVPAYFGLSFFRNNSNMLMFLPVLPLAGLFWVIVGIFILRKYAKPIVFDRQSGLYLKGRRKLPLHSADMGKTTDMAKLSDIHAIQILQEYCQDRTNSRSSSNESRPFYSYELNLILKDGSRLNVIDHSGKDRLVQDAEQLANFLSIPVWNAIPG